MAFALGIYKQLVLAGLGSQPKYTTNGHLTQNCVGFYTLGNQVVLRTLQRGTFRLLCAA